MSVTDHVAKGTVWHVVLLFLWDLRRDSCERRLQERASIGS